MLFLSMSSRLVLEFSGSRFLASMWAFTSIISSPMSVTTLKSSSISRAKEVLNGAKNQSLMIKSKMPNGSKLSTRRKNTRLLMQRLLKAIIRKLNQFSPEQILFLFNLPLLK
uniref:Uncharacterized protein n=1 Tax=Arundo donax TaxID=35708 RepID=A0A0A9D328_ARUDO